MRMPTYRFQADGCSVCGPQDREFSGNLSTVSLDAFNQVRCQFTFQQGRTVFMEGHPASGVYFLHSGRVKLYITTLDGRSFTVKISSRGEVLGLDSAIAGRPYEVTAEVLQTAQLSFVSTSDFLRFLQEHADAAMHVALLMSCECRAAYELVRKGALCLKVEKRLARLLLEYYCDHHAEYEQDEVDLHLTHEELAEMIGSSRESVTRVLSELRRSHVAELRGPTLVVRNREELERLAS